MNEVERAGGRDLNSNPAGLTEPPPSPPPHHPSNLSTSSTQSSTHEPSLLCDFVHDNNDYQWFIDYGYRDGCLQHTAPASVLSSLCDSAYGCTAADRASYYEALSKNLDANLAEADMESFRTQDIHALLTTLPDMQLCGGGGEAGDAGGDVFASVTGSMLAKFDTLDGSTSGSNPPSSADTMSICKSEPLFSPVRSAPCAALAAAAAHHDYSMDSLDCAAAEDLVLTCVASNKHNYTIAFEGSVTASTDSCWSMEHESMARSDSGLTTWSKLKRRSCENQLRRQSSGNNNGSGGRSTACSGLARQSSDSDSAPKSLSMPDLHEDAITQQRCVKVFDIQHQSDMAVSVDGCGEQQHNLSLVSLFMRQRSEAGSRGYQSIREESECSQSVERLSFDTPSRSSSPDTHHHHHTCNNNNSSSEGLQHSQNFRSHLTNFQMQSRHAQLINKSMQTSTFVASHRQPPPPPPRPVTVIEPSFLAKLRGDSERHRPVYVVYPSYTLPDLAFLKNTRQPAVPEVMLAPQRHPAVKSTSERGRRPFSCGDVEALKRRGFGHVRDWDSLTFLLPAECRRLLADVPEVTGRTTTSTSSSTATQPSSGYRGSSTMLTESMARSNQNPLFVYRYDSATSSETSLPTTDRQRGVPPQPPPPPRPPLPRSILRKNLDRKARNNMANKRYSMFEMGEEDEFVKPPSRESANKRKSLHDPGYWPRIKTFSEHSTETEDEGVELCGHGTDSSLDERFENMRIRANTPPMSENRQFNCMEFDNDELRQLEDYLKISGISCEDATIWGENDLLDLKAHVADFLSLKINKDRFDLLNGKRCVNFADKSNIKNENYVTPPPTPDGGRTSRSAEMEPQLGHKRSLVSGVTQAVERLVRFFAAAEGREELEALGRSSVCARLVLSALCPALYALLSEGLRPAIDTSFGPITNSVWRVVEASAQQGPLTEALGELVARINGEDILNEGVLKFNAFVIGK